MSVNNIDYSTLSVTSATQVLATTCSPVMPSQAKGAVITLETAPIRWRDDGEVASATEGHRMNVGDVLTFDSWTVPKLNWRTVLARIQVIREGATSGALKISWYD